MWIVEKNHGSFYLGEQKNKKNRVLFSFLTYFRISFLSFVLEESFSLIHSCVFFFSRCSLAYANKMYQCTMIILIYSMLGQSSKNKSYLGSNKPYKDLTVRAWERGERWNGEFRFELQSTTIAAAATSLNKSIRVHVHYILLLFVDVVAFTAVVAVMVVIWCLCSSPLQIYF